MEAKILSIALLVLCALTGLGMSRRPNKPMVVQRYYSMKGYSETPYEDCGGNDGKLVKVEVIPTELDGGAVILRSGTNATINIEFSSKVAAKKVRALVHGILGGIPLPFHVPQPNACQNSGIKCPLTPSTTYSYSTQIPVLRSYPRVSVKVKWELVDEDNKDIICAEIPAKIKS